MILDDTSIWIDHLRQAVLSLPDAAWKSLRLGAITTEQFQVLASRAAEPFSRLIPSSVLLTRATLITANQRLVRNLQEPRAGLAVVIDLANVARWA